MHRTYLEVFFLRATPRTNLVFRISFVLFLFFCEVDTRHIYKNRSSFRSFVKGYRKIFVWGKFEKNCSGTGKHTCSVVSWYWKAGDGRLLRATAPMMLCLH